MLALSRRCESLFALLFVMESTEYSAGLYIGRVAVVSLFKFTLSALQVLYRAKALVLAAASVTVSLRAVHGKRDGKANRRVVHFVVEL